MKTPMLVVTGHDEEGRSVILSADAPPSITPRAKVHYHELWRTGQTPEPLDPKPPPRPEGPPSTRLGPEGLGSVIRFVDLEPGHLQKTAPRADGRNPGMHRTESVDYVMVVDGEIWLELDDGETTRLQQHDVVIQNGTRHGWRNKSSAPATILAILIGARRRDA